MKGDREREQNKIDCCTKSWEWPFVQTCTRVKNVRFHLPIPAYHTNVECNLEQKRKFSPPPLLCLGQARKPLQIDQIWPWLATSRGSFQNAFLCLSFQAIFCLLDADDQSSRRVNALLAFTHQPLLMWSHCRMWVTSLIPQSASVQGSPIFVTVGWSSRQSN